MKTYTVEVTNLEDEQIVERLGYRFEPGQTRTVTVRQTSFMELDGAASLQTEIVETHAPPEPSKPEHLSSEYERAASLEQELEQAQDEQSRLAGELSASRQKLDEARADDARKKREADKPSAVKIAAPKIEAEYEDASYAHWHAALRVQDLSRQLHEVREQLAVAERIKADEREAEARAAISEAEQELRDCRNTAAAAAKRPGEYRNKARDAAQRYRELEAAGPAEG